MIYIDFPGGAYGHFLEYCVNRYLFDIECGNTTIDNLFDQNGASHIRSNQYLNNRKAIVSHQSYDPQVYFNNYQYNKNTDIIIAITVDLNDRYELIYNQSTRAGSPNLDFNTLEIDTLYKLQKEYVDSWKPFADILISQFGIHNNYPRSGLRNILYSRLYDLDIQLVRYINPVFANQPDFLVPMSCFSNFGNFFKTITELKDFLQLNIKIDESLKDTWEFFDKRNQAKQSKLYCDTLLFSIYNNQSMNIKCNLIEEAWINCNITEKYNITSDISCFSDIFPNNTQVIYEQIRDHNMKKQNLLNN